jgi:hypothetical protein
MHVDALAHLAQLGAAAPTRSQRSGPVGVVEQHHRTVALRERHHLGEGCDVAIHAVDAVHREKYTSVCRFDPTKRILECGRVAVWEDPYLGA